MKIPLILLSLLLISIVSISFYPSDLTNVYAQKSNESSVGSSLLNLLGNGLKDLNNQLGYSATLDGKQIFPNSTLKDSILSGYKSSTYNITNLKYSLLGYKITAHDIKIRIHPSKIDASRTRVDIPLMLAKNVTVTDGINLNYSKVDLGSVWGIYDKTNDKMVLHIPATIALKYLHL
jgi:hypothetical protein